MVPLSSLWLEHPFWVNPRTIIIEDEIASLATSIKEHGILVPPSVAQVMIDTGEVINLVIDGQQRVLASRRVLEADAQVPVSDVVGAIPASADIDAGSGVITKLTWETSDQLLAIALDIGIRRTSLSSFELVETAERLRNHGRSGAEISRMIRRSESWVSRFLKARLNATAKVLQQWRRGDLSDEAFKDLAAEKDPEKQVEAAKDVIAARKSGDLTEARTRAKEVAASAKQRETKPAKEDKAKEKDGQTSGKPKPAVSGPQAELPVEAKPKLVAPSRAVLDDLLTMADKRPPTHDYVRGIMDMAAYAAGVKSPADFSKPWGQYLSRVAGTQGKPDRPAKRKKGKRK